MNAAEIAKGLTKAQRAAVLGAENHKNSGFWHPEKWYVGADRRTNYCLRRQRLIEDYLYRHNPLTPLGLEVRAILAAQETNDER